MNFAVNALTRSLNVFHLAGSACNNCDIEILDALTPKYDLERFGITLVGSIRHADVIYVLDGQWDFKLVMSVCGALCFDGYMPDSIVVGGGQIDMSTEKIDIGIQQSPSDFF